MASEVETSIFFPLATSTGTDPANVSRRRGNRPSKMAGFLNDISEWSRPEFKLFIREPFKDQRDIDPCDWDVRLEFYVQQIPRYANYSSAMIMRGRELVELFKTCPRNIAVAMRKLCAKGVVTPYSRFGINDDRTFLQKLLWWKKSVPDNIVEDPDTEWVFVRIFRDQLGQIGQFLRSHYAHRVLTTADLRNLLSLSGMDKFIDSSDTVRLLRANNDILIPIFENDDTLIGWVFTL